MFEKKGTILGDRRRSTDSSAIGKPVQAPEPVKLSPEERRRKQDGLLREYLASNDVEEACDSIKELKSDFDQVIEYIYMEVLEKKERERSAVSVLVVKALQTKVVQGAHVTAALGKLFAVVEDLEMDIPMVGTYVAVWVADVVANDLANLADLKGAFESLIDVGLAANVAAKVLNAVKDKVSEGRTRGLWEKSGLDMTSLLPAGDRDEERVAEFAVRNKVEWLYPLMGCKKYLNEVFSAQKESAATVVEWLNSNVAKDMLFSAQGARMVMRALLSHFGEQAQKKQFEKYAAVAFSLYGVTSDTMEKLQLQMVYEVQLFCHERNFEAGVVCRLFHLVYDCDIVTEDAFMLWKDDLDDATPGKRRTLLEANNFIQWLKEAEEEDEEEEEDD
jgi:hypothetical protein